MATARKALDILENTGTVMSSEYDCNCKKYAKIKKEIKQETRWYKISGYQKCEINNRPNDSHLNWILATLGEMHPVIIGLYQNTFFRSIRTEYVDKEHVDDFTRNVLNSSLSGKSNHVVCIVGYDPDYRDGKGYFLVKNNYLTWGVNGGFAWISTNYLMDLIHEAYFIEDIVD